MPDQISTYRQVRWVLQVPQTADGRTYYSVHAVGVRRGVPTSVILLDGVVASIPAAPSTEEILEAYAAALSQHLLS